MANDDGFLSRWSRRKVQARTGEVTVEEPEPAPKPSPAPTLASAASPAPVALVPAEDQPSDPPPPLPTMDDVMALTKESDFSRFVKPDVDPGVRNAAFKKLFSDPFFNEMDGLDIYIDDYSQPNPLPLSLARKLTSAKALNLFETPEEKAARLATEAAKNPATESSGAPGPLEQPAPESSSPSDTQDLVHADAPEALDAQGAQGASTISSDSHEAAPFNPAVTSLDTYLTPSSIQPLDPSAQPKHTP